MYLIYLGILAEIGYFLECARGSDGLQILLGASDVS
jgi:hypothetical protein